MDNKFFLMLKVNDKVIATREHTVTEYNEEVIRSLRLNKLMKDMCKLVDEALKDNTIDKTYRLYE